MLTVTQMSNELWELLGEPSDLDPATANGQAKLLQWFNEAQKAIASYEFPDGHILRFPFLYEHINHKAVVKTGTLSGGTATTAIFGPLDATIGSTDEQYTDWVIEITGGRGSGQTRLIMAYNGANKEATVHPDWEVIPDSTSTFRISKRFIAVVAPTANFADENLKIDPRVTMVYPLRIDDVTNKREVAHAAGKGEVFLLTIDQVGTPQNWSYFGTRIIFDYAPNTEIWYRIEYYRKPIDMVAVGDSPELPDEWGRAIILHARWWGFARGQETGMAYAAKRDFVECMAMLRQQFEMGYERQETGVQVETK